ncbi:MAG: HigA family addiction module antitoxin [Flavobacteriales bacterium]|jgi:addiction module HigA family antidote|nr:HigA family addiction module antitoxin [Flavobacteriales bacterium]
MLPNLNKIKGIHPGMLLKRELSKQNLKSSELAQEIGEHKQTISAIVNQRRGINPSLSIKLSKVFNTEMDYFMLLQASYDVKVKAEAEIVAGPDLTKIRSVVFWDTDMRKLDWVKNRKAIIQRILERGNDIEINEIIAFYGKEVVVEEVRLIDGSYLPSFERNVSVYELR